VTPPFFIPSGWATGFDDKSLMRRKNFLTSARERYTYICRGANCVRILDSFPQLQRSLK
jgi:hypothetical protein